MGPDARTRTAASPTCCSDCEGPRNALQKPEQKLRVRATATRPHLNPPTPSYSTRARARLPEPTTIPRLTQLHTTQSHPPGPQAHAMARGSPPLITLPSRCPPLRAQLAARPLSPRGPATHTAQPPPRTMLTPKPLRRASAPRGTELVLCSCWLSERRSPARNLDHTELRRERASERRQRPPQPPQCIALISIGASMLGSPEIQPAAIVTRSSRLHCGKSVWQLPWLE